MSDKLKSEINKTTKDVINKSAWERVDMLRDCMCQSSNNKISFSQEDINALESILYNEF